MLLKLISLFTFFNVAIRKTLIRYVAHIIFLLVSTCTKANGAGFGVRLALLSTTPNYTIYQLCNLGQMF